MLNYLIKFLFCTIFMVFQLNAYAGEQVGEIKNLVIRDKDGIIFFNLEGNLIRSRPTCAAATSYWMIRDENSSAGKRQLALLLTAVAGNKPVRVIGFDTCTRWKDGEDINHLEFM